MRPGAARDYRASGPVPHGVWCCAEFSSLAEAIVYQQLNGKAAVTIFKRFAALAGEPLTPEGILKLSDEQLRSVGLSKQKSAYLKDLAAKDSDWPARLFKAYPKCPTKK